MRIVFVHGWGYGPDIWEATLKDLGTEHDYDLVDLGFTGAEFTPVGHYDLAVGHSMGSMWLLSQKGITWTKLISINGFTSFTQGEGDDEGVHPKVINRMLRQLSKDPRDVLEAFHQQSDPQGLTGYQVPQQLALSKLIWGLEFLRDQDLRSHDFIPEVHALADQEDLVVTSPMSRKCFSDTQLSWTIGKGHLLPMTAPEICSDLIRKVLDEK